MNTVTEIENEIVSDFNFFPDWTDKYQYIIELGNKLKDFPEDKKKEDFRIKGCQSTVWLTAEMKNGRIIYKADSDSAIVKGLAALLIQVLSNQKPDDIINAKLDFIEKIGLRQHLAQTRANGLGAMIKQMKMYALAYKMKLENTPQNGVRKN
jgi:cysteine desulfuration protein SufE